MPIEVDIWVRGTLHAKVHRITSLPENPNDWDDADARALLSEMLIALDGEKNPGGERPSVTLRGISWIVSPYQPGSVIVHVEVQIGTASAGPLAIDEARLTGMLTRVMAAGEPAAVVH